MSANYLTKANKISMEFENLDLCNELTHESKVLIILSIE